MEVCAFPEIEQSVPNPVVTVRSERDRTSQIREALGYGWRLPLVDEVSLSRYYRYLRQRLLLPFTAWYPEPENSREEHEYRCSVVELIEPASGVGDIFDGIFCKIRKGAHETVLPLIELELPPNSLNHQLVENYWYWFWHWR